MYSFNELVKRCSSTLRPFVVPSSTVARNALRLGIQYLHSLRHLKPGSSSVVHATETFASKVVLSHVLGIGGRLALSTKEEDFVLNNNQLETYSQLIERVGKGEPLQYVIGEWSFGDIEFNVTPDVLIPRPDSEVVIEAVEAVHTTSDQKLTFVDIGVGSGCLLLSLLKKYPNARGVGLDISHSALKIAHQNASKLGLLSRTSLFCLPMQSLLQSLQQSAEDNPAPSHTLPNDILQAIATADVIISNPPYIKTGDMANLQAEVRDYEPTIALDGGEDGLKFYRILGSIFEIVVGNNLKAHAFFEIGFGQKDDVAEILAGKKGVAVLNVHKDRSDIDRCIVAYSKSVVPYIHVLIW